MHLEFPMVPLPWASHLLVPCDPLSAAIEAASTGSSSCDEDEFMVADDGSDDDEDEDTL